MTGVLLVLASHGFFCNILNLSYQYTCNSFSSVYTVFLNYSCCLCIVVTLEQALARTTLFLDCQKASIPQSNIAFSVSCQLSSLSKHICPNYSFKIEILSTGSIPSCITTCHSGNNWLPNPESLFIVRESRIMLLLVDNSCVRNRWSFTTVHRGQIV